MSRYWQKYIQSLLRNLCLLGLVLRKQIQPLIMPIKHEASLQAPFCKTVMEIIEASDAGKTFPGFSLLSDLMGVKCIRKTGSVCKMRYWNFRVLSYILPVFSNHLKNHMLLQSFLPSQYLHYLK